MSCCTTALPCKAHATLAARRAGALRSRALLARLVRVDGEPTTVHHLCEQLRMTAPAVSRMLTRAPKPVRWAWLRRRAKGAA